MNKEDIYLRQIEMRDIEAVLDWENNVEGWNMEEKSEPYSVFDIISLIQAMQDVYACKQVRYMVCHKELKEAIGAADLTDMDFENATAGVGILIADSLYRNKGFASRALELLEDEARNWKLKSLKSTVLMNNDASVHLFEKLGYEKLATQEESYFVEGVYIKALVFEKWLNAY